MSSTIQTHSESEAITPAKLPIAILKRTLASIETKLASERDSIGYHERELEGIRMRSAAYAEQVEALRATIALLEQV